MAIEFRCTQCNKLLRTADDTAGKRAKCPECGAALIIPAAGAPAAGAAPPPPGFGAAPPPGPAVTTAPPISTTGAAANAPLGTPATLELGDIFRRTFAIFKSQVGTLIVLGLIWFLAIGIGMLLVFGGAGLASAIMRRSVFVWLVCLCFGMIGLTAVLGVLLHGILRICLKIARGEPAALGELFSFGPTLVPFLLTFLAYTLLVNIGYVLCIVPGIAVALFCSQCVFLVLDRNMALVDALKGSVDLTAGSWLTILLIWLIAGFGASIAGTCTCGLGYVVAMPFLMMLSAVIYLTLTNQPTAGGGPAQQA